MESFDAVQPEKNAVLNLSVICWINDMVYNFSNTNFTNYSHSNKHAVYRLIDDIIMLRLCGDETDQMETCGLLCK